MPNKLIKANDGTLVGNAFFAVGSVQQSFLDATEFESIMGTDWVLADGRSVTGSLYETITGNGTVPDCRGLFLRTVGGNADPAIGGTQTDTIGSHTHPQIALIAAGGSTGQFPTANTSGGNNAQVADTAANNNAGAETRPVNITVNTFIKIN